MSPLMHPHVTDRQSRLLARAWDMSQKLLCPADPRSDPVCRKLRPWSWGGGWGGVGGAKHRTCCGCVCISDQWGPDPSGASASSGSFRCRDNTGTVGTRRGSWPGRAGGGCSDVTDSGRRLSDEAERRLVSSGRDEAPLCGAA